MSERKQFLVVGGSKGIGFEIVQQLVELGHQVHVLSRTAESLQSLPGVSHHPFDVMNDEVDVSKLPTAIHGLAYCPGSINLRSFKALKPETFRADFELNVVGAIRVLQSVQSLLAGDPNPASVVLFSTVAVGQGMFAHASIAAAKGAIEGLTRTLAVELAPKVRVNCIAPALTETAMTSRFFTDPEKVRALGEKYPMARTGTAAEVARLACFLLDPSNSWITGQVIGIDGGMSTLRK